MFIHQIETDFKRLPVVKRLPGNVFTKDTGANQVRVVVTDNGQSVTLYGDVKAYIKRPGGASTLNVTGTKDGNIARVVLPSEAYDYEGMLGIYLRLEFAGQKTTLGGIEGYCYKSQTSDLIYDPAQ